MTAEYVDQVAKIEQESFSKPWSREMLLAECQNQQAEFYVALKIKQVIGYFGLHVILDEGYITNIAVAQEHRRQGVGTLMIEEIIAIAREKNLAFLTLEVRPSNVTAKALYSRFGFALEGVRKRYYENPIEDALIMTRRF